MYYVIAALMLLCLVFLGTTIHFINKYEREKAEHEYQYELRSNLERASARGRKLDDAYNELLSRIDAMSQLYACWDGFDAQAISLRARLVAYAMVGVPTVSPLQNGTVQFHWTDGDFDVTLTIGHDGVLQGVSQPLKDSLRDI